MSAPAKGRLSTPHSGETALLLSPHTTPTTYTTVDEDTQIGDLFGDYPPIDIIADVEM